MKYQNVMEVPVAPVPQENNQFLHTSQAGVDVPLKQALVMGVLVFVFVLVVGWRLYWMDPWTPALICGMSVTLTWFGWWLWRWSTLIQRNQPQIQISSVDHDNDQRTPNVIRIQLDRVTEQGHVQQSSFFDLPEGVAETMMADLANGILHMHRPFTETEWSGPGKPFSRPKFYQLRALMENRKLIELKNEKDTRQGFKFNSDGEQFLKRFLP